MGRSTHLSEMADRTVEILQGRTIDQCGAICFRLNDLGAIEVLLITSRDTGRWVIPKGNIEKSEPLHKCARREALEEAGVIGSVGKRSIGYYTYLKDSSKPPFLVSVFALQVENAAGEFKEAGTRKLVWVSPSEAAALVDEPELKGIFRLISGEFAPKAFRKAIGRRFSSRNRV